jgi:hypothetical protein
MLLGLWILRPSAVQGFGKNRLAGTRSRTTRLLGSSSASISFVDNNISRINKLQKLLFRRGAPGSIGCSSKNDLIPVVSPFTAGTGSDATPELISSMDALSDETGNLYPFLYPIAKSKKSGHYICAYRDPHNEVSTKTNQQLPWPIVESSLGAPGMRLLALNSEHLMRRIVCECDFEQVDDDIISMYNEGLGSDVLDAGLDTPYTQGDVDRLGYGIDKYCLLRVGPFPDLYMSMSKQHAEKGDERSSLIAAEAASRKLPGFGSTYLSYARLLQSFPQREEEARDAARMCLRLPLATIGLSREDLREVAVVGQIADASDDEDLALKKLAAFYKKMKEVEKEDPQQGKTTEQFVIDEVNSILDKAALEGKPWSHVRQLVSEKLRSARFDDLADFVNLSYGFE